MLVLVGAIADPATSVPPGVLFRSIVLFALGPSITWSRREKEQCS
jgi:hypothetical protein